MNNYQEQTEDLEVFGKDAWVYCTAHCHPHTTGWCTVPARSKIKLEATNRQDAEVEVARRGLNWRSRA